jgi:hypothetical protein
MFEPWYPIHGVVVHRTFLINPSYILTFRRYNCPGCPLLKHDVAKTIAEIGLGSFGV